MSEQQAQPAGPMDYEQIQQMYGSASTQAGPPAAPGRPAAAQAGPPVAPGRPSRPAPGVAPVTVAEAPASTPGPGVASVAVAEAPASTPGPAVQQPRTVDITPLDAAPAPVSRQQYTPDVVNPHNGELLPAGINPDSPALTPWNPDTVNWIVVPRTNRRYAKFLQPGDTEMGRVLNWNADEGSVKFGGKEECGYIDLWSQEDGGVVRIGLDSGRRRTAAIEAQLSEGDLIAFEFIGWEESKKKHGEMWKDYNIWVAPAQ